MKQHNWGKMKPDDGFFAALNVSGEVSAELVFGLYVQGSLVKTKHIDSRRWPTARQIGDLKRRLIFWEGLAEYLNAGGNPHELSEDFNSMLVNFNGSLLFEGWSYFDTGVSTDGNRVHEFISDNPEHVTPQRFVRWVRNEFIDYKLTELDMLDTDNHGYNDTPPETDSLREIGLIKEGQADE